MSFEKRIVTIADLVCGGGLGLAENGRGFTEQLTQHEGNNYA